MKTKKISLPKDQSQEKKLETINKLSRKKRKLKR